jgi:hypothetical protein
MLTGLSTNTAASRILSLSTLPVKVVAHERRSEIHPALVPVARGHPRSRETGDDL